MERIELQKAFLTQFDAVGIIQTKHYLKKAEELGIDVPPIDYPTMVVLGLAYPKRLIKNTDTYLVPSFYTFGSDYHQVLKDRIDIVVKELPYRYQAGVDNHPHDERLAAVLAGMGYFAKNQLIINPQFGTYFFLGIVFMDFNTHDEIVFETTDDCGTCTKCIDACPVHALSEHGCEMNRCMSHYNQTKRILSDSEIDKNYALFGCDICQMVCPKNINKGVKVHSEFELSGKEKVQILDLFTDTDQVFKKKYGNMSYLWKGKTILMRNALTILLKQRNTQYNELIEKSIHKYQMPWYHDTATKILEKLKKMESKESIKMNHIY